MPDLRLAAPLPALPTLLPALRGVVDSRGRVLPDGSARADPALAAALRLAGLELSADEAGPATPIAETDPATAAAAVAGIVPAADGWCAFNPFPLARRAIVRLALAGAAPPAVIDAGGARHPAQPDGDGVLVGLPLGALQSLALRPHPDPVAGCHWEVSERVLDNGRVRAEFDADGAVVRLCVDGVFAPLTAPIAGAVGRKRVHILEQGPVRARLQVEDDDTSITWELQAHDDQLRAGLDANEPSLAFLVRGGAGVLAAGAGRAWRFADEGWCRWGEIVDVGGDAILGLACDRPGRIAPLEGGARFSTVPGGAIALRIPTRRGGSTALAAATLASEFVPARTSATAALRLVELGTLAPLAIAPADGAVAELLLAEGRGRAGRAWLFPGGGVRAAWRVDARGNDLGALPLTPEGDGVELAYAGGDVLLVRWR